MINGFYAMADFTGDEDLAAMHAAQIDILAFYCEGLGKDATQAFIQAALAAGFGLLPIAEWGGRGNAGGTAAGRDHAARLRPILDAHGVPRDVLVANAESDYDADPNSPAVAGYYPAFWSTLGQSVPGLNYAGGNVGRAAKAQTGAGIWLTCSGGFAGSASHDQVDVWQRCAGETGAIVAGPKPIDTSYWLSPTLLNRVWNLRGVQPNPTPNGWVTVTEGMQDGRAPLADPAHAHEVAETQLRLIRFSIDHHAKECNPGPVDGIHDYESQIAIGAFKLYVQQFQKAFHLPVWPPAPNLPFLHQIDEPTINALRFFTTPAH